MFQTDLTMQWPLHLPTLYLMNPQAMFLTFIIVFQVQEISVDYSLTCIDDTI